MTRKPVLVEGLRWRSPGITSDVSPESQTTRQRRHSSCNDMLSLGPLVCLLRETNECHRVFSRRSTTPGHLGKPKVQNPLCFRPRNNKPRFGNVFRVPPSTRAQSKDRHVCPTKPQPIRVLIMGSPILGRVKDPSFGIHR